MRTVGILIVGDEILKGEISDLNGPYVIQALSRRGVEIVRLVVTPDDVEAIATDLTRMRALADAVVLSGGIGPTHDDVTRPAVARVLGRPLVVHAEAARRIRGYYGDRVTDAEMSMASMPQGARLVSGERTGTFGFEAAGVYALPGVPFLFRDLVDGLARDFDDMPLHREEVRTDRREGELAPHLAAVQGDTRGVMIGSYPVCEDGCWHVRVVVRGRDPVLVAACAQRIRTLSL